jgi:hypothetical protein
VLIRVLDQGPAEYQEGNSDPQRESCDYRVGDKPSYEPPAGAWPACPILNTM